METTLTYHAEKRMKERLHIKSIHERERRVSLALERGKLIELEEREWRGSPQTHMILSYQNLIYVFSKEMDLITILRPTKKKQSKAGMLQSIRIHESKKEMIYA